MAFKKRDRAPSRRREGSWELVEEGTDRLAVPGGWIYRVVKKGAGIALCFVPRPPAEKTRGDARVTALQLRHRLDQLKALLDRLSSSARMGRMASTRSTKIH